MKIQQIQSGQINKYKKNNNFVYEKQKMHLFDAKMHKINLCIMFCSVNQGVSTLTEVCT